MSDTSILPDDEPASFPSRPTMRGGDPATLGRIDHYDLLRKLGGGGFGVVYLARDSVSGIEVAIKTLHPLLKHNAEEMDLLREKFKLVHGLTHPNIAKALVIHLVRDVNIRDDSARSELKLASGDSVMVMDYAPGVTLSKWRRQFPDGVVPFDRALEIGRQVAAALDYAHGERIVHRDIKPSNVMVETVAAEPRPLDHGQDAARSPSAPTLRVRILDFGLAAEIRSSMSLVSTEQGDTSGTRPYMAPEQWLGRKQDGRTDQYALASVLYELLSGSPPFAGVFETGDPAIMRTAVTTDTPDEIEDADPTTNAALLRALAKDPKARFPSCAAFVAALGGGGDAGPGGASRPGEPQSQAVLEAKRLRMAREEEDRRNQELGESEINRKEKRIRWGIGAAVLAVIAGIFIWGASQNSTTASRPVDPPTTQPAVGSAASAARLENAPSHAAGERFSPTVAGVSVPLRWCPPGTFTMGSPSSEQLHGNDEDETQHSVTLTKGFWMGETEVTQGLWKEVMDGTFPCYRPPSMRGDDRPVECVSWNDCQRFLEKLNAQASVKGFRWDLPSEAQWEYACRAGSTTAYSWGKALNGDKANCDGSWPFGTTTEGQHRLATTPVRTYEPNAWGLYDMHGNVCEWCSDWYDSYPDGDATDPTGPSSGSGRVCRGGSADQHASDCRSAWRRSYRPDTRNASLGFRIALVPVP